MTRQALSRQDQKAATRALFLKVGRRVFAKHGFDVTSVAMLCRAARTTHGALYHHFPSKLDLFVAVFDELTHEVAAKVRRATEHTAGWAQVEAACDTYLDACTDPDVQAILFRDGPRVLTSDTFDAIDHGANEPLVTELLTCWIDAGSKSRTTIAIVARMLGGAFAEAGAAIAASEDPQAGRAVVGKILLGWIGTLRSGFDVKL
ncbi:MAG: TetR/AcrR family transcriptional regulator [Deltaproteobacteria bacterium]|nr:TetR/AcrR family transcriptional regulator [Deltaproteobacteria bacterium]